MTDGGLRHNPTATCSKAETFPDVALLPNRRYAVFAPNLDGLSATARWRRQRQRDKWVVAAGWSDKQRGATVVFTERYMSLVKP